MPTNVKALSLALHLMIFMFIKTRRYGYIDDIAKIELLVIRETCMQISLQALSVVTKIQGEEK